MQQLAADTIDLAGLVADLNTLLRLKTTVIGMKLFAHAADMEAILKIRRPNAVHTTDQIVSMASRLGWTVGITADDLVGAQCRAVIGLSPQDEKWLAGENYVGVWHGTAEDARKRQEALDVVPFGRYQALAVSPLASGRLDPPDICLVYATPGQMIILINGCNIPATRSSNGAWSARPLARIPGDGRSRAASPACPCHAMPNDAMAACRTRRC